MDEQASLIVRVQPKSILFHRVSLLRKKLSQKTQWRALRLSV
jgi:hypothetical protein